MDGGRRSYIFYRKKKFNGKDVWYFKAFGYSYPEFDWFFKVRDTYEAFADLNSLSPYWANRNSHEGGYEVKEQYLFNYHEEKIISNIWSSKVPEKTDTIKMNPNYILYDLLTSIYYIRNLNLKKFKENEKFEFWTVIFGKVYPLFIRYHGKEDLVMRNKDVYSTLKFSTTVVEGTIFKAGENITVWVSDDNNHIALRIEAKIIVGSVVAEIKNYTNLKNSIVPKNKLKQ